MSRRDDYAAILQHLAELGVALHPGTLKAAWESKCLGGLLDAMLDKGRDVTIIVSRGASDQGRITVVTEKDARQ